MRPSHLNHRVNLDARFRYTLVRNRPENAWLFSTRNGSVCLWVVHH